MRAKEIDLNEERKYDENQLRRDFAKYAKEHNVKKKNLKKLWSEIYSAWYANNIHDYNDIVISVNRLNDSIAGGAGYAVYGGGGGRSFGNPSMGSGFGFGRGRGFGGMGGSMNLGGGPNLMYTYNVKPLTQDMQQPPTPQDDEETIHAGCKIRGKILNTDEDVTGQIVHIEEDHDNNIKYYLVLDPEDGVQKKVDPTSAYIVQPEEFVDPFLMNMGIEETYYPNLDNDDS